MPPMYWSTGSQRSATLAIGRRGGDPRIGEAREIPGRVDERVHGVGLAPRRLAALRTGDVLPGGMTVERIARAVEVDVARQLDRQLALRHRHDAAALAVDDRDRTAPIALARDAPVAQAEIDLPLRDRPAAARLTLEPLGDLFFRRLDGHAVEEARIDHAAVAVIGGVGDHEGFRIDARRAHHRRVAEPVFVDEVEVALVVRRAAEDRAGAVVHQDEVGDVDRQLPVRIERMDRLDAGVEALLLRGLDDLLRGAVALALGDEFGERRVLRGRRSGERMVGRDRHEPGAEQGVVARGEDLELALGVRRRLGIEREPHQQPFRAADPVALHDAHLLGPAVEAVERLQQVVGIFGDGEIPLRHLALLDQRALSASRGRRSPARWRARCGRPGPSSPCRACARPARRAGSRGTSSAGACSIPDRRSRSRAPSRATAPST